MILIGSIAAVLLAAGLIPPYWEIWKRRGRVIGINWVFLSIDSTGAFFSLLSLAVQNTFDILGGVLYIICVILELGIFASHIIWRLHTRSLHKRAKLEGIKFDDLPEARKYQDHRSEDAIAARSAQSLEEGRGVALECVEPSKVEGMPRDADSPDTMIGDDLPKDLESASLATAEQNTKQLEIQSGGTFS